MEHEKEIPIHSPFLNGIPRFVRGCRWLKILRRILKKHCEHNRTTRVDSHQWTIVNPSYPLHHNFLSAFCARVLTHWEVPLCEQISSLLHFVHSNSQENKQFPVCCLFRTSFLFSSELSIWSLAIMTEGLECELKAAIVYAKSERLMCVHFHIIEHSDMISMVYDY